MLFLIFLVAVTAEEFSIRASELQPRNYNHHAHNRQYLEEVEPTKQGPVLFPNDAPPPPRPPLVVTSRPLAESIARSNLNPTPPTPPKQKSKNFDYDTDLNSIAEQSRLNRAQYLAPSRLVLVNAVTGKPVGYEGFDEYSDRRFEKAQVLPPRFSSNNLGYQVREPAFSNKYQSNRVDDNESDLSQDSNYAFSYKVRDQKTGDDFSHHQQSSGSATNGEYRVRLPDGRTQIVSYTADENGYKADVRYDVDVNVGNPIANNIAKQYAYETQNPVINNNAVEVGRQNLVTNVKDVANSNRDFDYDSNNALNYDNHNYDNDRQFYKEAVPVKEEYQYADIPKDYELDNEDYSLEYNGKHSNYEPHRSKFNSFAEANVVGANQNVILIPNELQGRATLKPSIEELRNLFLHKKPLQPTPDYLLYNKIPVEINVPSTTPRPEAYDSTSEHVVIIGTTKPNLYTNVRSSVATPVTTPAPLFHRFSTPSFLPSTARSFNNVDFSGGKPVLSDRFIDRINKYLTY